jgi:hypothetical protein
MIYIKTRMRKMPECCIFCDYSGYQGFDEFCTADRTASSNQKMIEADDSSDGGRPAWCPLVEREEKGNG